MFYNAKRFNQDLSGWNISSVMDTQSMFQGASSYNQNLCAWGTQIYEPNDNTTIRNISVSIMFGSSGCLYVDDPVLSATSISGPFCQSCSGDSAATILSCTSSSVVSTFGIILIGLFLSLKHY